MLKKIILGLLVLVLGGGALLYLNRQAIILHMVSNRGKVDVAEHREIEWKTGPATSSLSSEERPPNIVFILVDDLGINDLSTFGGGVADGQVPTPNIDKLAADGALFTQAYSGSGTCAPSRAMLMTGRYPTRTGFEFTPTPPGMGRVVSSIANGMDRGALPPIDYNRSAAQDALPYDEMGLPGSEVTVAELLRDEGYHTVHIGKWHLGRNAESRPTAQGFDESLLMASGLFLPEDSPDVVNAKLDFDPIDKFLWARMQFAASYSSSETSDSDGFLQDWFEPGGYLTDYWTDESLKVIEANKNRPFFLYLAHWGVHTPLQATKEDYEAVGDVGLHRLRVYAAMLRALDRSIGRIVQKLEEEGLAENTVIVFSSDNGGAGYIGLSDVNAPYRGWKITLFEGGIRVPLFIKWPARVPAGTVIDTPVAHIDVMPTLAAAGGASVPANIAIDGKNLLPAATRNGGVTRENDALFWQSGYYRVVRAGDWKLQVDGRQKKTWLFNLADDPTEQINLADSHPEKADELADLLETHYRDAVPPLYPHTLESPIAIDITVAERASAEQEYVWWPN